MMILRLSSKCSSEYDVETSVGTLNLSNMHSIYSNTSLSHSFVIWSGLSFFPMDVPYALLWYLQSISIAVMHEHNSEFISTLSIHSSKACVNLEQAAITLCFPPFFPHCLLCSVMVVGHFAVVKGSHQIGIANPLLCWRRKRCVWFWGIGIVVMSRSRHKSELLKTGISGMSRRGDAKSTWSFSGWWMKCWSVFEFSILIPCLLDDICGVVAVGSSQRRSCIVAIRIHWLISCGYTTTSCRKNQNGFVE